jgi:hypothetical protein
VHVRARVHVCERLCTCVYVYVRMTACKNGSVCARMSVQMCVLCVCECVCLYVCART